MEKNYLGGFKSIQVNKNLKKQKGSKEPNVEEFRVGGLHDHPKISQSSENDQHKMLENLKMKLQMEAHSGETEQNDAYRRAHKISNHPSTDDTTDIDADILGWQQPKLTREILLKFEDRTRVQSKALIQEYLDHCQLYRGEMRELFSHQGSSSSASDKSESSSEDDQSDPSSSIENE